MSTLKLFCYLAILFAGLRFVTTSASARIFTNTEGLTIEGELVSYAGKEIRLKRANDRKVYTLSIDSFSAKDQFFIKNEIQSGRLTKYRYNAIGSLAVTPVTKDPKHLNASRNIDRLLAKYLKSSVLEPAPVVEDSIFLRRAYLKIIGRIPTYAEAVHFLNDENENKRSELIDKLLDSPGYVSHNYNLWADVLRARSVGQEGSRYGGAYYVPWIKDQIRGNTPYDEFVEMLLTAEGYPWDNPATAYYLRDFGMPLDNMSMTAQVFLGTQMQCAQCHNHPTDVWTQRDFYELSAMTHGLKTGVNIRQGEVPSIKPILEEIYRMAPKKNGRMDNQSPLFVSSREFFDPWRWGVVHSDQNLRFPHDYQYKDAKPKEVVSPNVPFGELASAELHDSKSRVESFADWLVSENNERFTTVIANRMWAHAMGIGIIDPFDNMTEETVVPIPELMEFLEALMKSVDYDLKQYLRVIYNTDFFQREAVVDNPDLADDYNYQGPVFQRMTAEQIWDSIATLMTPDIDMIQSPSYKGYFRGILYESGKKPAAVDVVESLKPDEVVSYIEQMSVVYQAYRTEEMNWNAVRADPKFKGTDAFQSARTAFAEARKEWRSYLNSRVDEDEESSDADGASMMTTMAPMVPARNGKNKMAEGWVRNIRRASELQSPQANGHLLEVFGQSDRLQIENSDNGSNVLQALFLMNSPQTNHLLVNRSAPVLEAQEAETPLEKLETLYVGFLARKPTPLEVEALLPAFEADPEKARERIIWAMLNTQQFYFIQ